MSICALSSYGQDPAFFTNYFNSGGLQLPEMAEIAVIGTSLTSANQSQFRQVLTDTNNKAIIHYGTFNDVSIDEDVLVIPPKTYDSQLFPGLISNAFNNSNTYSAVMFDVAYDGNDKLQIVLNQAECRNMNEGEVKLVGAIVEGDNPGIAINQGTTVITAQNIGNPGDVKDIHYLVDTRKLFVGDNGGVINNFQNNTEGIDFDITTTNNGSDYEGLCGGICFGNSIVDYNAYDPVVNVFDYDVRDTETKANLNKFDIGWEIKDGRLFSFYHSAQSPPGSGGIRERFKTIQNSVAFAPSPVQVENTVIKMRYVSSGANQSDMETAVELFYQRAGGALQQFGLIELVNLNQSKGHFAVVGVPSNNDIDRIIYTATHHNDRQIIQNQAVGDANVVNNNVFMTFSKVPVTLPMTSNFKQLTNQYANSASVLGFAEGDAFLLTTRTFTSSYPKTHFRTIPRTPLVIQFLDLGITGYLGGGSTEAGGANEAPIVAICDGITPPMEVLAEAPKVWELCNKNWVKLQNAQSQNINQLRVKITDMTGRKVDYLSGVSSVWFEVRASRTPAIKMPGTICEKPKPCTADNPNNWIRSLAKAK